MVNEIELKKFIVSQANYYRKEYKTAKLPELKHFFDGHIKGMRVLWDTMKMHKTHGFGLYDND